MNEIATFSNEQFGEIRTLSIDGEPWFVGKDVTDVLGYTNSSKALADHVKAKDKLNNESLSSLGQRGGWLINEAGVYSLVFRSKLPSAEQFTDWITHEVIPSIRKTGSYSISQAIPDKDKLEMELMMARAMADDLRLSATSKAIMYEKVAESHGLSTAFIPEYSINTKGQLLSAKELLSRNGCTISSRSFNERLTAAGYLEDRERQSSKKDDDGNILYKKFK